VLARRALPDGGGGVMLHQRSEWTSTPAAGSPWQAAPRGVCIHWNGPPVAKAPALTLAADRRYHVDTKGWADIAYNLAVDQLGDVWIARGLDYRSSANGTSELNHQYVAVLALIGQGQEPTPAMLAGLRAARRLVLE